ncbi:hypothetical protein D9V75_00620 [Buchnera aphidicola (Muscaphis stroyani)]|uniref:Uncharacterized protein n=1 Tax=Buchnera aphidicola (Muscaphis stroyani) TaxID=1241869 RepID=A0A4D6Y4M1_9GAMM|nr:hypothetical protein D9V75_00620 [Buchnera aphidicola (Muscaphis stroyani)]
MVNVLITNFYFPKKRLIMLVDSFVSCKNKINAYREAIKNKYCF